MNPEYSSRSEAGRRGKSAWKRTAAMLIVGGWLVGLAGCGGSALEFREVKRIDEKVTEAELATFLRVVESLPEKKLPPLPPIFAPPPEWSHARTLPVNELVRQEEKRLEEQRSSVDWLVRNLPRSRALQRALRREGLTAEQFVGLTLAIGIALARTTLREDQDLTQIIARGEAEIEKLDQDSTPFSELSQAERYRVLRQAVWITRVDRARRLIMVPPENIALVQQHREQLEAVFPEELKTNPLDAVADLLEELGTPFVELPESGSDADLTWDPAQAIIGTDPPDPEWTAHRQSEDSEPQPSLDRSTHAIPANKHTTVR